MPRIPRIPVAQPTEPSLTAGNRGRRRPAPRRRARGLTVIDLIVALAVLGLLSYLALPPLQQMSASMEMELATREVAALFRETRLYAVTHDTHVGVKFRLEADGSVTTTVFRDGDGDGVLSKDIASGDDRQELAPMPMHHVGQRVHFGFPPGPMPREIHGRRRLDRREDPIRFNRSDIASFGPRGTATPGTVYLTDGRRRLAAVRVIDHSGQIEIYHWHPDTGTWQ